MQQTIPDMLLWNFLSFRFLRLLLSIALLLPLNIADMISEFLFCRCLEISRWHKVYAMTFCRSLIDLCPKTYYDP